MVVRGEVVGEVVGEVAGEVAGSEPTDEVGEAIILDEKSMWWCGNSSYEFPLKHINNGGNYISTFN